MKSERRHELEKNVLADRLGGGIQAARPVLPILLIGLVVVLVAAVGWGIYSATSNQKAATAWTDYYFTLAASDAENFADVAEQYPNSTAGRWAHHTAGNLYLQQGLEAIYRNRAEAEKALRQAVEAFELAKAAQEPRLRVKAHYGLAQAHEALGEVEPAAEYYQLVIDSDTYPAMIDEAKKRLAFLTSENGREFYAWFNSLTPQADVPLQLPSNLSIPPTSPGDMMFDPVGDGGLGGAFPIPPSATENPDLSEQALEFDSSNLPPIPGEERPANEATDASEATDGSDPTDASEATDGSEASEPAAEDASEQPASVEETPASVSEQ